MKLIFAETQSICVCRMIDCVHWPLAPRLSHPYIIARRAFFRYAACIDAVSDSIVSSRKLLSDNLQSRLKTFCVDIVLVFVLMFNYPRVCFNVVIQPSWLPNPIKVILGLY